MWEGEEEKVSRAVAVGWMGQMDGWEVGMDGWIGRWVEGEGEVEGECGDDDAVRRKGSGWW